MQLLLVLVGLAGLFRQPQMEVTVVIAMSLTWDFLRNQLAAVVGERGEIVGHRPQMAMD
jgi:hypothetical protein|tara:strand:+ start:325 stop:501 length:177 start_codon:yes stop_codon:yes gene_type:complete